MAVSVSLYRDGSLSRTLYVSEGKAEVTEYESFRRTYTDDWGRSKETEDRYFRGSWPASRTEISSGVGVLKKRLEREKSEGRIAKLKSEIEELEEFLKK